MPRFALTVRLKTCRRTTLKTSVVAPPMSTPTTLMPSRSAMVCMMLPTAPGVGMIGASVHCHQLVVAGRLRHDVLEEQIVDRVARGEEVLALEHGPQVVHDREGDPRSMTFWTSGARVLVAGVDDRQLVPAAEARARVGRSDQLRDLARRASSVPPSVPPDIRIMSGRSSRMRSIFSCGRRPSFDAMHVHDDRARAERRALRALARSSHEPRRRPSSAARRRRLDVEM